MEVQSMPIKNPKDNSFKVIFDNNELFVQFLRRFARFDILKNVRPDDIENLNERHLPLFQENRDSDTIKKINLRGRRAPLYVIAVLEHESKVNFRAVFKMLLYITLVLDHYEKQAEKEHPGITRTRKFRYPPVLPIIFYDGTEPWTVARTLAERTELGDIFSRFIPCFEYLLISLRDYPLASLAGEADPLSFFMLIDKVRGSKGGALLKEIPEKYFKSLQIPRNMRKMLSDVTQTLLNTGGVGKDEIEGIISRFNRGEYQGMFEGIIEGYKKSYRWGYRQAKARYGKLRQQERDQLQEQLQKQYQEQLRQDREQLRQRDERIRQDREQLRQRDDRIRQYQEEIRRLRGE
jgi:hypothetical protein